MASIAGQERITEWARQALLAMRQRQIAPTPENFTVWFHVASDAAPALSRLVRVLDDQQDAYDESRCSEIHHHFFGDDKEREQLRVIGDRVENHLSAIGSLVGEILEGTSAYGSSLDGAVDALPASNGLSNLHHVLVALRNETKRIRERTDDWGQTANSHAEEVSKLQSDLDAARTEAETDALTKIGNRRRFDRRLREAAAQAVETEAPLSVILLDVDHFKSFNDTYGHSVGDRVLKVVAGRLAAAIPESAEAFRYGGEEFAIITPSQALGTAVDTAETVRKAVATTRIARKSDSKPLRQVTISLGVSQYEMGEALTHLVDRADTALYGAKNSGRNCTSIKRAKSRAA